MSIEERLGVYFYVGKTQSGKTTRAIADLKADGEATGWPRVIIDTVRAKNWRGQPHAANLGAVLDSLWGPKKADVIYTPSGEEDFAALMRALIEGMRVHVLVDECRWWANKNKIVLDFSKAMRAWAHSDLTFRCTTQHPADLHSDAFACITELHIFRTDIVAALDRLEEYGFDRERMKTLPRGDYLTYRSGF